MSDITPAKANIQIEATRQRSAVSEFLEQTMGGAINYLNAQDTANIAAFIAIAANSVAVLANAGIAFSGNGTHADTVTFSTGAGEFLLGFWYSSLAGGLTAPTTTIGGSAGSPQGFSLNVGSSIPSGLVFMSPSQTSTLTNNPGGACNLFFIVLKNVNITT